MPKSFLHRGLIFVAGLGVGLAAPAEAANGRSPAKPAAASAADTSAADTTFVARAYEFVAYPMLQAATWPIQNVLAPAVEFLTYPTQPPIRYFLEENVIERATGLFRVGAGGSLSVYPTLSIATGTASRTGATLRDEAPFGYEDGRLVAYFNYFVNGDIRFRAFLTASNLWDTPLRGKLAFGLSRFDNAVYYLPGTNRPYRHAYNAETYDAHLDIPVGLEFYLRGGAGLRQRRYGQAPGGSLSPLEGDFFPDGEASASARGFGESFQERVVLVGLVRDSRNNENIPLDGSRLETAWMYHDVDGNRDYHEWEGRYTKYFKLGSGRYELTRAEEAARGGLALDQFLRNIEYQRLRRQIFERKVLVVNLYAGRSFEIPGNRMPAYGAQSLGNGTPLRAYPGSRYRHYAVAAASAEYRFPLLRIMDGLLFNEYGVVGDSFTGLDPGESLRNSWGFGVRVRRADMFLFRLETAFRGFSGFTFNVSSDTPF